MSAHPVAGNCGQIDQNIFKECLNLAVDVYLDRVNRCLCGDGVIELFKGANSTQKQFYHDKLKISLKRNKHSKRKTQKFINSLKLFGMLEVDI